MTPLRTMTLDQCCTIVSGATPKTSVDEYWDGDILWTTPKDLSNLDTHYLKDTPRKITEQGLASCGASILPAGSVLFSSRAPIGHVAINAVPMATNQGFKSFIPKAGVLDAKFLFHWLRKNKAYLESLGNGATFKEVSKATVARIEIDLPPFPEQRRIAAILDQADALRAKRREALAQLDSLTQSIFIEMFGDPVVNPMSWNCRSLDEVTNKVTDGEHLNPPFSESGMPIVMAGNVLVDQIDLDATKKVETALGQQFRKKCGPEYGDLLIVGRGATIGRLCRVNVHDSFCLMGSVILVKPDRSVLDERYLSGMLSMPTMHAMLYKSSGSSAQQAIYLKDVKRLACPLPPLLLQQAFSKRIQAVEVLSAIQRTTLAELDTLFASLQHRAFRGEL